MRKTRSRRIRVPMIILLILELITGGIFTYLLCSLNLIPLKFVIIILLVLIALIILTLFLMRKRKKTLRIVGYVISVIVILISSVGSYYLYKTNEFMNKSFDKNKNVYKSTFYVLANKDSEYKKISDIKGSEVGYFSALPNIDDAIKKLNKKVSVENKPYEEILDSFTALDKEQISSVLIEKNMYESLCESLPSIKDKEYKIIYKFSIEVEEKVKKKKLNGNAVNIYIAGTDFTEVFTDFNMLVTINKDTHKILLTSTPRDFYVDIPGKGMKDLLTYSGVWGINSSIETMEKLYNTDINYFVKVNTNSLVGLVDTLGGVNFCSDTSYTTTHALVLDTYDDSRGKKLNVQKGCYTYSGIEILTIARERKAFSSGDVQRQKNCQQIMINIFKQIASTDTIVNYSNVLNAVSDLYTTNIPQDLISELAKDTINGADWQFEQQIVSGNNSSGYVHLGTVKDYIMVPNQDSVNKAILKIEEVASEK